ncbi:MAG: hypothetical protein H0X62_15645, partial [Bacteroidetes bacterium]|nr:hypothetical protein [Bacteroidota bacterium]
MKTKYILTAILTLLVGLGLTKKANACHSMTLSNFSLLISPPSNPGFIVINGSSNASTNGCSNDYKMVVQIVCANLPFPGLSSGANISPTQWTAFSSLTLTGTKPPQLMPYPQI